METLPDAERLDAAFFALSDATRRSILLRLARGGATVNELTGLYDMSQPAISRHLKVLEKAGLIRRSRDAQRRPATVETKPIADVAAWLEQYREIWERSYRRLDALLESELKARKRSKRS